MDKLILDTKVFIGGLISMDNNKNRLKDRPKTKAEMRKMYFEHGSELGIEDGLHVGAKDSGTNKTKTDKLYHKVKKKD